MADQKLSVLPVATSIVGASFYGVQGGVSKQFPDSLFGAAVSPRQFGAVGDGVTNDTEAFHDALDYLAANGGGILDGGGLTYVIDEQYTGVASNVTMRNMSLDLTGIPFAAGDRVFAFDASGSVGSDLALTVDAAADDPTPPTLTMDSSDAATLAANDLIFVASDIEWNPGESSPCTVGEMAVVKAVSGGVVTLSAPLLYSYAVADGAVVRKITPVENVTLEDLHVVGPANLAGGDSDYMGFFSAHRGRNVRVRRCTIEAFNRPGVEVRTVMDAWIEGNTIRDIIDQYGVVVMDAAQNIHVTGNNFDNTRHGVSAGGSATYDGGVVNGLFITGNTSVGRDAALDCHSPTDNVVITGNVCRCEGQEGNPDGIVFQGRNAVISGNIITGSIQNGVKCQATWNALSLKCSLAIEGNNVSSIDTSGSASVGIYVQEGILGGAITAALSIIANVVTGPFNNGIRLSNESASVADIEGATINGNSISGATTGIIVRATGQDIRGVTIKGNSIKSTGTGDCISLQSDTGMVMSTIVVQGNTMMSATNGLRQLGSGTLSEIIAKDNLASSVSTPIGSSLRARTIASGAVAIPGDVSGYLQLDTESAASTDELDTMTGGVYGQILTLRAASSSRDVVVKDGTGNLRLSADFTLTHQDDRITLQFDGTNWEELARSDNAA